MASLLFYSNPVPLEKEKHKNLKLQPQDNLNFTQGTNSIPLSGPEFFQCSRYHPIMFVKNQSEEFIPVALISLASSGHHLGERWEGVYVPSYVRRYPFILERDKGIVMIDEKAPHLQEKEGDSLFKEDGEPSEKMQDIMRFLESVDKSFRLTIDFIEAVKKKALFKPCKRSLKFADGTLKLDHLYVIDEDDFKDALSDEEIVDWYKKGWIAWTYAHVNSMSAIHELVKRLPQDKPAAAPEEEQA